MSDSDPSKTNTPKLEYISALCPKMDQVPDFSDGSEQQRCMGCDTSVFNLSALSEQEAHDLLDENRDICIRYATNDADEPIFRQNGRSVRRSAALAGGLSLALGMTAACGIQTDNIEPVEQESATKPTTNEQQTTNEQLRPLTPKGQKVGIQKPGWVGKVAHRWPKEVQQQIKDTKDKYNAGKMTKEEYLSTLSEIKKKAYIDMRKQ